MENNIKIYANSSSVKNKEDQRFEYIRAIAAIAVVIIHTMYTAIVLFGDETTNKFGIYIYRSVMNLMWFAVPCFLMLTGLLLLLPKKQIDIRTLYKKYVLKILIVLGIFGIIFSWMEIVFSQKTINVFQIPNAVINVIQGETWAHLWYLYCLLGIYITFPIWNMISKNASEREFKYILIILFIFASIIKTLNTMGFNIGFYNHISNIYPFWFLCGAGYHRGFFDISKKRAVTLILTNSALLLVLSYLETYDYFSSLNFSDLFGYSSILVIGQSVGLFALILKLNLAKWLKKVLLEIADKSFGIYLVHMLFVNFEYKLLSLNPFEDGLYIGFVLIIFNIILSYCCTWVLKKIPFIRKFI